MKLRIIYATTVFSRVRGLLFGRELLDDEGLLLAPASQVHTFFMKYAIDCIHLDKDNKVLTIETLAPYKFGKQIKGTKKILECKAGTASKLNIKVGDILEV